MGETYYTSQEVADKFGVKVITVWDWIRKVKLRALRVGGIPIVTVRGRYGGVKILRGNK